MSMPEQLRDDSSDEWSGQCQTGLNDEAVGDRTVAVGQINQDSFVSPSALQPGTRTLDEAIPLLDVLQRERVSVERNHAEHQKPASEDRLSGHWGCWQRVVLGRIRHVDERVKLEVDALHRGHGSPNLIALRGESGDNLDLDRTAHGFSMTKPQQRRFPSERYALDWPALASPADPSIMPDQVWVEGLFRLSLWAPENRFSSTRSGPAEVTEDLSCNVGDRTLTVVVYFERDGGEIRHSGSNLWRNAPQERLRRAWLADCEAFIDRVRVGVDPADREGDPGNRLRVAFDLSV